VSQRVDLYVPGRSWLHRIDPRAKLWVVLLATIAVLLFKQIPVLFGLLVLTHVALWSAGIPGDRLRWLWARLAPLLIMILILQPLFVSAVGPELVRWGPVRISVGGILDGVSFALRTATLAFVAAILLLTTDPAQLVRGLVKLGLPYTWGLTVGLAIRYLPTTYGLFLAISEAQQARGWIVSQGGLVRRIRAYLPILVATIIAALRLSDALGLALAARGLGYPARRTVLNDIHFAATDWLVVVVASAAFAGLLMLRCWYPSG
jgi:energy-coupling factor transport system permease protein